MATEEPARTYPKVPEVDPKEFLRALLKISQEDAEKARESSPATRGRRTKGDDDPPIGTGVGEDLAPPAER